MRMDDVEQGVGSRGVPLFISYPVPSYLFGEAVSVSISVGRPLGQWMIGKLGLEGSRISFPHVGHELMSGPGVGWQVEYASLCLFSPLLVLFFS